ncbi:MAG: CRISPR-associated helicase Cas3' [Candidatus Tectimicrobiota bacterium]
MPEESETFEAFFQAAFQHPPFDYQRRLATDAVLYALLNVPTGAGKTAAVLGAWLWRRLRQPGGVGRRLVYCLPMRTLVEQTEQVARQAIKRLEQQGLITQDRFQVHVLMGGDVSNDWDSHPERECILIGTQDMLLSRALNRGYAMSRFRWPVHFGLLNNDCLWVFDEVQLMGSGLATSTQLQAFRRMIGSFGKTQTIWMSATVERDWLQTVDVDVQQDIAGEISLDASREVSSTLQEVICAKKIVHRANAKAGEKDKLTKEIISAHKKSSRTLVVVNTVARAGELYEALKTECRKRKLALDLVLIHSRFRPPERAQKIKKLLENPGKDGTLIVTTQVVEAGVDVSAKTLFTELAPWPSLVQRFGRCNRRGQDDDAQVFWIDVVSSRQNNLSAPYDEKDMQLARAVLREQEGKDVGPAALQNYMKTLEVQQKANLLRYEHIYVIRQHDLHGLFSTEPDLAGGYTDVSMFVRNIEREADVYVYWRDFQNRPSLDEPPPGRNELCAVRFFRMKDLLTQRGVAWQWNSERGVWETKRAGEIRPGMTLLLATRQGGYHGEFGWTGKSSDRPTALLDLEAIRPQESLQDDMPSQTDWLSVPDHLQDTRAEAYDLVRQVQLEGELWVQCSASVVIAAWWHDVGKILKPWQDAGVRQMAEMRRRGEAFLAADVSAEEAKCVETFLLKLARIDSAAEAWAKFPNLDDELRRAQMPYESRKRVKDAINVQFRPELRHEAGSALAAWQEWQARAENWSALAVYLVACHHGKVRTVLRSTQSSGDDVFGIKPGSTLPQLMGWLSSARPLDLRLKAFGAIGEWDAVQHIFTVITPSWIGMMAELLGPELPDDPDPYEVIPGDEPRRLGPFRLAYLEALVRASDVRASRAPGKGKRNE